VTGAVYDGVYALDVDTEGSSTGSRAWFGTLGHHDAWRGSGGSDERGSGAYRTPGGVRGVGVAGALAGLGGAGYLLRRRMRETTEREE
jgi:hypothetical protein